MIFRAEFGFFFLFSCSTAQKCFPAIFLRMHLFSGHFIALLSFIW